MKIVRGLTNLFNNKYFLYFIMFLAVTNVFGYLVTNKLNGVIFFVLVSLLTYQFSKNMAIVLLVALLSTNLLMANKTLLEGLENNESKEEDKLASVDPKLKKGLDALRKSDNLDEAKQQIEMDMTEDTIPPTTDPNNPDMNNITEETNAPKGVELTRGKKVSKENYEKLGDNMDNTRVDYAATLEEAYDNLDKMLGSDGINKLTKDTQKLMAQQQKLFDTMQNMSPMLEQAKDMLKGFDLKSLSGLAGLASSFNSQDAFRQVGEPKQGIQKISGTQKGDARKLAM